MSLPPFDAWMRMSPLLDELLELPPLARALRLRELQGRDAPLAAKIAAFLDASARADAEGFLAGDALARARLPRRCP
jgi:hypothetical protein